MAHAEPTLPLLVHYDTDTRKLLQLRKELYGLSETKLTIIAVDFVLSNPKLLEKLVKEATK